MSALLVTTPERVWQWAPRDQDIHALFESPTGGIVAAKLANELLAVADGQVVLLHDVQGGTTQSYKLRSDQEGQVRTLRYNGSLKRLYFTTTLQHAVQAFSLSDGQLLDPATQHPSPPTAFAISPTSDVLLSASSDPAAIYLTSILPGRIPLLLQPTCSALPVAAAAFHPAREIFALAFTDGTVSAYDVGRLRQNLASAKPSPWDNGEIGHILNLHQTVVDDDGPLASITAVAFVPDATSVSTVSVGLDAKCHIVGFDRRGLATISKSWQLPTSATALAVTQSPTNPMAAIGLANGEVRLYTLDGSHLFKHSFETRVLAIEWMDGDSGKQALQPPSKASSEIIIRKHKPSSLRSSVRRRNPSIRRVPTPAVPPRPPIPKEGGKWAQQQAERASTESQSSEGMLTGLSSILSTPSEYRTKPKGKKIVIRTHGRMARKKHPPPPEMPQPAIEPTSQASVRTGSLTPHSHDTVLDWGGPSTRKNETPRSSQNSSQTPGSYQSVVSSWPTSAPDSSGASPGFLPALTSSQASSAPQPPRRSPQHPPLPPPLSVAQVTTVKAVPLAAPPVVSPGGLRQVASQVDRQSIITTTTQSTGTLIDWVPHASQNHALRTLARPIASTAAFSESPETSSSSFVFSKPQQPSNDAAQQSGQDADSDSDRAATPRATESSASSKPNGQTSGGARRTSSDAAAIDATPQSRFPSGPDSTITPMLLQAVFEEEFALFQTRIMLELREQREWAQSFLSEHVASASQLGEENRRLREELARLQKG